MSRLPFVLFIGCMILIAGVLAVNATDAPRTNPADCVAQYFQLCPKASPSASEVRACVESHKSRFHPICLEMAIELAKGFK